MREDGLEMYLIDRRSDGTKGHSIFVAKRASKDLAFDTPAEVSEFRTDRGSGDRRSRETGFACVSPGETPGRTNPKSSRLFESSTSSNWEEPRPLPITNTEDLDGELGYPSITSNGLRLFCCLDKVSDGRQRTRLMSWRRDAANEPFSRYEFIALPDLGEIVGWCPRYFESQDEMFFCSTEYDDKESVDLFCIKPFEGQAEQVALARQTRARESGQNKGEVVVAQPREEPQAAKKLPGVRRLRFSVSETGECAVVVDPGEAGADREPKEGNTSLTGVSDARVVRGEEASSRSRTSSARRKAQPTLCNYLLLMAFLWTGETARWSSHPSRSPGSRERSPF